MEGGKSVREITVAEAAARSGYGLEHMRALCRSGQIRARRFAGVWAVDEKSLEKWMAVPHPRGPKGPRGKRS